VGSAIVVDPFPDPISLGLIRGSFLILKLLDRGYRISFLFCGVGGGLGGFRGTGTVRREQGAGCGFGSALLWEAGLVWKA
jgi:hypothetical protein